MVCYFYVFGVFVIDLIGEKVLYFNFGVGVDIFVFGGFIFDKNEVGGIL